MCMYRYTTRAGYAVWNDACIAHTQGYYGDYMDNPAFEVPAGSGVTLAASLQCWLNASTSTLCTSMGSVHIDLVSWPQNAPCSKAHA